MASLLFASDQDFPALQLLSQHLYGRKAGIVVGIHNPDRVLGSIGLVHNNLLDLNDAINAAGHFVGDVGCRSVPGVEGDSR